MNIQLNAMRPKAGIDALDAEWTKTVTVGAVPTVGSYLVVDDGAEEHVFEVTRVVYYGVVGKSVPAIVADVDGFFAEDEGDDAEDFNAR